MRQVCIPDYPPMFDEIAAAFPLATRPGVVFSWGERLYAPTSEFLPDFIVWHESAHGARQGHTEKAITDWWKRYLDDVKFRANEELYGHGAEWLWWHRHGNRKQRRGAQSKVARRLSSRLYGNTFTYQSARRALKELITQWETSNRATAGAPTTDTGLSKPRM